MNARIHGFDHMLSSTSFSIYFYRMCLPAVLLLFSYLSISNFIVKKYLLFGPNSAS